MHTTAEYYMKGSIVEVNRSARPKTKIADTFTPTLATLTADTKCKAPEQP